MINRLILWLSLAGMILTVHLWVQQARGFDQGCLGLEARAAVIAEGGCNDASLQAGSRLLGVSNVAWGYAFYFGLAVLSFGKIVATAAWSKRLHALGEILVVAGFLYSGYLLYFQTFVAEAFCVLCLLSIGLVTALFVLHAIKRLRGGHQPVADGARTVELGMAGGALFVAMGALIGMLVFVNRLGTRPFDQGSGAAEMRRIVGRMLPAYIDPEKLREMRACHFDAMATPLDLEKFIGRDTPFLGKAGGMPVIVFFDPHCGHCRRFNDVYLEVAEKYGDRARFYILPRVLWDYSIPAVAALKLAETSGKYFDVLREELKPLNRQRLNVDRLMEIYRSVGLDPADLAGRIESIRSQVIAERKRATTVGIRALPAVFINGRQVFSSDHSADCLGSLIEDALAGLVKADDRVDGP